MSNTEPDLALLGAKANFEHAVKVLANTDLNSDDRAEQVNESLSLAAAAILGLDEIDALAELGLYTSLPAVTSRTRQVAAAGLGMYIVAVNNAVTRQSSPDGADDAADEETVPWLRHLADTYTARADAQERLDEASELFALVDPNLRLPEIAPENVEQCSELLADLADSTI